MNLILDSIYIQHDVIRGMRNPLDSCCRWCASSLHCRAPPPRLLWLSECPPGLWRRIYVFNISVKSLTSILSHKWRRWIVSLLLSGRNSERIYSTNQTPTSSLPVAAGCQLRHHHPASPGLQVSLCGHLTARSVLVHLPDALHLAAAAQAHIRRRLYIRSFVHRHWREGELYTAGLRHLRASTSANRPLNPCWCTGTSAWCAWCRRQGWALSFRWLLWSCFSPGLVLPVLLFLEMSNGFIQKAAAPHSDLLVFCRLLADHLFHHLAVTWWCHQKQAWDIFCVHRGQIPACVW